MLAGLQLRRPPARAGMLLSVACLAAAIVAAGALTRAQDTGAVFTNEQPAGAAIAAARIFEGERVTPAFSVSDHSSGSAADASSANAFGNDGRYFMTRSWATSFSASRYLELDLNDPLPAGLAAQNATAAMRFASDAGTGSVCVYLELRRASNGTLLSSHGSAGSPLGCTSGSSYVTLNPSLSAVTTSDIANDLRVRIYALDTAAGAMRLDQGTVSGDTPYASWTLYPIVSRESYSGQLEVLRWGLAGP